MLEVVWGRIFFYFFFVYGVDLIKMGEIEV